MKKRSRARELALQFLYQVDLRSRVERGEDETAGELDGFLKREEGDAETAAFARRLIEGALEQRSAIDTEIRSVAKNWELERMAVIDRNVLRLGTHELLHRADIPPKVSINEAIELGKRYSTENSGGFINGILDKIKDKAIASGAIEAPSTSKSRGSSTSKGKSKGKRQSNASQSNASKSVGGDASNEPDRRDAVR